MLKRTGAAAIVLIGASVALSVQRTSNGVIAALGVQPAGATAVCNVPTETVELRDYSVPPTGYVSDGAAATWRIQQVTDDPTDVTTYNGSTQVDLWVATNGYPVTQSFVVVGDTYGFLGDYSTSPTFFTSAGWPDGSESDLRITTPSPKGQIGTNYQFQGVFYRNDPVPQYQGYRYATYIAGTFETAWGDNLYHHQAGPTNEYRVGLYSHCGQGSQVNPTFAQQILFRDASSNNWFGSNSNSAISYGATPRGEIWGAGACVPPTSFTFWLRNSFTPTCG